jgi:hypothetical protein
VAEGARLESVYTLTGIGGSNPSLSARSLKNWNLLRLVNRVLPTAFSIQSTNSAASPCIVRRMLSNRQNLVVLLGCSVFYIFQRRKQSARKRRTPQSHRPLSWHSPRASIAPSSRTAIGRILRSDCTSAGSCGQSAKRRLRRALALLFGIRSLPEATCARVSETLSSWPYYRDH